jgi:hypothetical protein
VKVDNLDDSDALKHPKARKIPLRQNSFAPLFTFTVSIWLSNVTLRTYLPSEVTTAIFLLFFFV